MDRLMLVLLISGNTFSTCRYEPWKAKFNRFLVLPLSLQGLLISSAQLELYAT